MTGDQRQVDVDVELNPGVQSEDEGVTLENVDAKKCMALQHKMCHLAERLYPGKGASHVSRKHCYKSNIRTSEADLIGDKHYDKTYRPLPLPASDSDSEASISSAIHDENGDKVIIVGRASVQSVIFGRRS